MNYRVVYSPRALEQMTELYRYPAREGFSLHRWDSD